MTEANINIFIILPLLLIIGMEILRARRKKSLPKKSGRKVILGLSFYYPFLAVLLLSLIVFLTKGMWGEGAKTSALVFSSIFCLSITVPIFFCYINHFVVYNEKTITVSDWKGTQQTIHWDEITDRKLNVITQSLLIYTKDQKLKVYLMNFPSDFSRFVMKLAEKTNSDF